MNESEEETLEGARQYVVRNLDEGTHCPCCDQFAKRYYRVLNSGMAGMLCWLYSIAGGGTSINVQKHSPRFVLRAKDYSLLRWWGLITAGEKPGEWKITLAGVRFVTKQSRVSQKIALYNNKFAGFFGGTIDIDEALGTHFDYNELMSEYVNDV